MSLKKVLHVCPYLHPRAGGPAILVPIYCRLLPQHGWQASVLTTDWYSPGGCEEIRKNLANDLDITVLATGSNRFLALLKDRYQAAQVAFNKADIFHVHGLWHPLGWMVRQYARANNKPYVISTHGMLDRWSMNHGKLRKLIYYHLFEKRNLQHAARIIFTTEEESRHVAQLHVNNLKSTVILLGANDPPAVAKDALRKIFLDRYPVIQGRNIILFFGRLHQKKGLHIVIEFLPKILKQVPGALLLVVGDGDTPYVNKIKKQIADLKLADNVLLTGFLEAEDKWSALAASDVFVLPSSQENFAMAVAEVMKMNIPVVISNKVDIWPYVKAANAGVILTLDATDKWPVVISDLLLDDNTRKAMGDNATKMAFGKFSWDSSTAGLVDVYNSIYNGTPA